LKVIIAGSRNITDYNEMMNALDGINWKINEVVSGAAKGVDQLGEQFAKEYSIPLKQFPADWEKFGRSAGYKRNIDMSKYADALLAIWDGVSVGTKHMIEVMMKQRKPIFIYYPSNDSTN
jgi:hypothetical protein